METGLGDSMGFKSVGSSRCFSIDSAEEEAVCIRISITPTQRSFICDSSSHQQGKNIACIRRLLFIDRNGERWKDGLFCNCQLQQWEKNGLLAAHKMGLIYPKHSVDPGAIKSLKERIKMQPDIQSSATNEFVKKISLLTTRYWPESLQRHGEIYLGVPPSFSWAERFDFTADLIEMKRDGFRDISLIVLLFHCRGNEGE